MANKTKEVDEILDGLTGDIRVGQKYYFFTGLYHYFGRVAGVSRFAVRLDDQAILVMNAGSATDAVSQIIAGRQKPEISECPRKPIYLPITWITSYIEA
jgi:hypothetical protein